MTAGTRFATSRDGTRIAYNVLGEGPKLVIVNGAMGFRGMSFAKQAAAAFARYFTVIDYDRRGRGESGDAPSYSVSREVEDLDALIRAVGEPCAVFAQSSGAALALKAAAAGAPIKALVAYEPPYMVAGATPAQADYGARVTALIAEEKRDAAIKLFMVTVGVPRFFVPLMRLMPFWKDARTVAHTLPYDAAIMDGFALPTDALRSIRIPVVAAAGEKTPPVLRRAAEAVAATVPGAQLRIAPKMSHAIKPTILAPLVRSWLAL